MQRKTASHLLIPGLIVALFFGVAFLPVELIGCRNRALIAVFLALGSGVLGIASAVRGIIGRVRNEPRTVLWVISALILSVPALYIVMIT